MSAPGNNTFLRVLVSTPSSGPRDGVSDGLLPGIVTAVVIVVVLVPVGLNLFDDTVLVATEVTFEGLLIVVEANCTTAAWSGLVDRAPCTSIAAVLSSSRPTEYNSATRPFARVGDVAVLVGAATVVSAGTGTQMTLCAPSCSLFPLGAPCTARAKRARMIAECTIIRVLYLGGFVDGVENTWRHWKGATCSFFKYWQQGDEK
ncbi:hypothetical protein HC256_000890 [Beauveria bassiana]|nr:hypothetical protein HC256_000890 [Beauveria bassiana]